jgi:hypothetical protein
LRILPDRSRANTHIDAHDLAGLNNRPGGRRLITDGACGRFVIMRLAFDIHPEAGLVKILPRRFFRFAYYIRDFNRAPAHGKVCDYSRARQINGYQQHSQQQTFEDIAQTTLRKQTQSPTEKRLEFRLQE